MRVRTWNFSEHSRAFSRPQNATDVLFSKRRFSVWNYCHNFPDS